METQLPESHLNQTEVSEPSAEGHFLLGASCNGTVHHIAAQVLAKPDKEMEFVFRGAACLKCPRMLRCFPARVTSPVPGGARTPPGRGREALQMLDASRKPRIYWTPST